MGVTGARATTSDLAGSAGRAHPRRPPTCRSGSGLGVSNGAQAAERRVVRRRGDRRLGVRAVPARPRRPGRGAQGADRAHRGPRPGSTPCVGSLVLPLASLAAGRPRPGRALEELRRARSTGAVLPRAVPRTGHDADRHRGQAVLAGGSTDKRLTLVFFGYTHCPDECPTTMATLASAMLQLDDADRAHVAGRVRHHRPRPRHRPGDPALARPLRPVVRRAHRPAARRSRTSPRRRASRSRKGKRLPSGGYDVTHGTQVLAVDGEQHRPRRLDARHHGARVRPRHPPAALLTIPRTRDRPCSSPAPPRASGTSARCRCAATRCASSPASWPRSGSANGAGWPAAAPRARSPTSRCGRCRSASSAAGSTT